MAQQPSLELPQKERARFERKPGAAGRARKGLPEGNGRRPKLEKVSGLPAWLQGHVYPFSRKGKLETEKDISPFRATQSLWFERQVSVKEGGNLPWNAEYDPLPSEFF